MTAVKANEPAGDKTDHGGRARERSRFPDLRRDTYIVVDHAAGTAAVRSQPRWTLGAREEQELPIVTERTPSTSTTTRAGEWRT